jgi:phosphoglycolate phosphatase-like HAD superfamily hydrolase
MMQALLFELDGTLIDSSDDLTRALNAAFAWACSRENYFKNELEHNGSTHSP